jgi:hypothetical protein
MDYDELEELHELPYCKCHKDYCKDVYNLVGCAEAGYKCSECEFHMGSISCDDCHNYLDDDGCNCQGMEEICHEFRLSLY